MVARLRSQEIVKRREGKEGENGCRTMISCCRKESLAAGTGAQTAAAAAAAAAAGTAAAPAPASAGLEQDCGCDGTGLLELKGSSEREAGLRLRNPCRTSRGERRIT